MRNLSLLRTVNLQDPHQFSVANKYCIVNVNDSGDSKSNRIQCFIFTNDLNVHRLNISNNVVEDCHLVVNLHEYITERPNVAIVGYTFLFNYLFIVLSDGHCFSILLGDEDIETKSHDLNINVSLVSWSPDINRTAIIDHEDVLHLTNLTDDGANVLFKIPLQDESEEQNPSVNVGWGSVETQFRGTEGKFSKSKPNELASPEISDDATVNICWKQNSTMFAVSYLCRTGLVRKVKIFDQDGALLNVTKDVNGLLAPIDWCSSRNLISCVQNLPNKKVVCFLEQNALRHGDFQITETTDVLNLRWNSNGSILACHERNQGGETISLWTTSNYKWYQKQCLAFSERVTYFQWDFDVPNRLHAILESGIYRMYEWIFQVIESGQQYNDDTNPHLVAVVNGSQLNLTPYRQVCLPPSIPFTTHSTRASINAVIFPGTFENSDQKSTSSTCSALLYLSDNRCALITYGEPIQDDLYCFSFGDDETEIDFETPLELSAWYWVSPDKLYFNWNRMEGNYFCAALIDAETKAIVIKDMVRVESAILAISNYESAIVVHTDDDGSLFMYLDNQFLPMQFKLLEPCFHLQILDCNVLIALSEHRNLYINEDIKWRDIVSFHWKPPFLVLIKMNSQLLITKVDFFETGAAFNEVQIRQIEPKSYLVTIVDDEVLLEMDRGNLEVVTPRPFSIFKMEEMLKPSRYGDVFKMFRRQRIDLNIIYDREPRLFFSSVESIVKNLPDPTYLTTFVTELVDESVAANMFPWKYGPNERGWEPECYIALRGEKVSKLCDEIIAKIKKFDVKKFIQPLIAALVRKGNLAEAADYSIEHNEIESLCHLADPLSVYKAALASYNITSALRIIEYSKLDPSEYLPFIRELEAMDDNYRKFKICNYLEKYEEALKFLSECPDKFDECVAYIEKHELYVPALRIFSKKNKAIKPLNAEYIRVLTLIADVNFSKRQFEEAGVLYEKLGSHEKAFECYVSVGDWFSASSVFTLMDNGVSETDTYKTLYESLLKRGQYVDAAYIAFHYSKNCKEAVDAFLTAKKYCSALNAAKGLRNEDIIEETIHPRLIEEMENTMRHIRDDRTTIEKYFVRLKRLRDDIRRYGDLKPVYNDDSKSSSGRSSTSSKSKSSDSSSSTSSRSSTSSTSSEKKHRRRERKLWSLKTGNPREIPSLIAVIKDLFLTIDKVYPKFIPDLAKALVKTDEIELARELKSGYSGFLEFLRETRDEVWPTSEVTEEGGFKDISIRCPPDITNSNEALKLLD